MERVAKPSQNGNHQIGRPLAQLMKVVLRLKKLRVVGLVSGLARFLCVNVIPFVITPRNGFAKFVQNIQAGGLFAGPKLRYKFICLACSMSVTTSCTFSRGGKYGIGHGRLPSGNGVSSFGDLVVLLISFVLR
jgi:hypothetical protein